MTDTSFDVLIRFITEIVGKGPEGMSEAMASLVKNIEKSEKELTKQNITLNEQVSLAKDLKAAIDALPMDDPKFKGLSTDLNNINGDIKKQTELVGNLEKEHKDLISAAQKLAKEEDKAFKQGITNQKQLASTLTRTASTLQGISNTLVIGGTAVAGGLFKMAKDFIDSTKEDSELTREWKKNTEDITRAYGEVGKVAASEIMPFLKEAAAISKKIAILAQQNPQIIGAGVRVGLIALAIGAIGKAVASGIKLYADATYITAQSVGLEAAQLQFAASENQLIAAGKNVSGTAASGAAGLSGIKLPLIAAGLAASFIAVVKFSELMSDFGENLGKSLIPKLEDMGSVGKGVASIIQTIVDKEDDLKSFLNTLSNGLLFTNSAKSAGSSTSKGVGLSGNGNLQRSILTNKEEALVKDYVNMLDRLKAEEANYAVSRLKILEDSSRAMLDATRSSFNKIKQINEQATTNRDSIISNFVSESKADQQKFESERAQIVRDGGLEIQRLEQERFEKLRQLELDHNDRVDELAANRDALGLVLEQRKYDKDKAEVDRQTNVEIAKRRQDLAIRLQDLQASFAAERAQRQAQYIQDLKDNEAKRQADIKAEREHLAEQQREIAKNRAQQLRDLSLQHQEEIIKIRQAFTARRQELGIFLNNEQQIIRQAHSQALADLKNYLSEEARLKRSGGGLGGVAVPQFAIGGYTPDGIIRAHGGEFIANRSATSALERMIGGRLNQQNLVEAVAGNSVQWNDNRRFDGTYSKAMKRAVQQDTLATIAEVFKK